jgi:hypothetical protein
MIALAAGLTPRQDSYGTVHYTPQTTPEPAMMNEVQMNEMTTQTQVQLQESTVDYINQLVEDSYHDGDIYAFIQEFGEEAFVNHYEEYVRLGESVNYQVVDAFIQEFGVENLSSFDDAYYGDYDSEEQFVESYIDEHSAAARIEPWIVIDYTQTWESSLQYDFVFNNGYVFNRNF